MTAIAHPNLARAEFVASGVTRRSGLVAALTALSVALAVIVSASTSAPSPVRTTGEGARQAPGAGQAPPAEYIVGPGDTVWSIARSLHPEGDLRSTVDRLIALNGSAALRVGQSFRLR